jgi:drug/metabolite transporter (DMT)-like permease
VAVGFVGVLVILRPGLVPLTPASVAALASAGLAASAAISIKVLARTESAEAIVIYMVLIMTPLSLLAAAPVWAWPSWHTTAWLVLTGFFGTVAHWCLTHAYKLGDASALTPITFVQLPVVAILAWWLFGEPVDVWTIGGAGIICGSTLYIAHREAQLAAHKSPIRAWRVRLPCHDIPLSPDCDHWQGTGFSLACPTFRLRIPQEILCIRL